MDADDVKMGAIYKTNEEQTKSLNNVLSPEKPPGAQRSCCHAPKKAMQPTRRRYVQVV